MVWQSNTVTDTLKVQYPIIQAPMLGVSTPEMSAAISNEGGLGSLAVGGLSPEATRQLIRKIKSLTGHPFAVNLFSHPIVAYTEAEIAPMRRLILQLAGKRGYPLDAAELTDFRFYNHLDQIDVLIEEAVSIVSFTFGCLDDRSIERLHANGCLLIGTATCLAEALYLEAQHIDMIVLQGIEAGGHRGTFLDGIPLPQVGLFALQAQAAQVVRIPCIAAGGIYNAQTIQAAFCLGAGAVQIGSAFIATTESGAVASYKVRLAAVKDTDTALTKAFSGRWARGLRNELTAEIEQSGIPIPPYPVQNSLMAGLRKLAQQANDAEYTSLWAGQCAGGARAVPAKEVFGSLVEQYEALCG
jgi:nitronate monooxygenase